MGQHIEQIILAARRGLGLSEKIYTDIKPEIFSRKPRFRDNGKDVVVDCNHPAFVFGHLSLYPARIAAAVGADASAFAAPAEWTDLFKAGAECKDDPEHVIYPRKDVLVAAFQKAYNGAIDILAKTDDAVILQPHPDEMIRTKYFPTLGAAAIFTLNSHVTFHVGQISTWRRCFGLPSAM